MRRLAIMSGMSGLLACALAACNLINGLPDIPPISVGADAGGQDATHPGDAAHDTGHSHHDAGRDTGHTGTPDVEHPTKAPQPLAPLSTSIVTSQKPTFHWALPAGIGDATIDFCTDRACDSAALLSSTHVTGDHFQPKTALPVGVVFWRLHPATDTSLTSATWEITVGHGSAPVDTSWGTMLDVNGDGYADVAVAAVGTAQGTGTVYVFLGGMSGIATTPTTILTGPGGPSGAFGSNVKSAGDVNGDGYADLIVGAPSVTSSTGQAYVYLGGSEGLSSLPATTLVGTDAGDDYGDLVVGLGDVNGDGYGDIAVGAIGASMAYVYLGSKTGIVGTPATTLTGPAGTASGFGRLGAPGDVNGDGYADLVVGAPTGSNGDGNAYVYYGGAFGIATTPDATLDSPVTGGMGGTGVGFGSACSGAGDVNGDGYADVLISAPSAASGAGAALLYLGSSTGIGASPTTTLDGAMSTMQGYGVGIGMGDVNGDGFGDFAVSAPAAIGGSGEVYVYYGGVSPDGGLAVTYHGALAGTVDGGAFASSMRAAGDVNRDGYGDIAVGAPSVAASTGEAYIFLGGMTGPSAMQVTRLVSPATAGGEFGTYVFGANE